MSNIDAINATVREARAAAEQAAGSASPPAVHVSPANQNVSVAAGRPVSLGEMLASAGMQVKGFLKVSERGFQVGKDTTTYFDTLPVEFRISSIQPFYGVRFGNPAKYLKSLDRLTESRTKRSWADTVAEAQRLDARCTGDYASADIPVTLMEDAIAKDKKTVLFSAGDSLGLTLSITNFAGFAGFMKPYSGLVDKGVISSDTLLRGTLVAIQRTSGSNTWGLADFQDFNIVDEAQAAAA